MPEIVPFKGIVYGPGIIGDASRLICPPYDAISPSTQQELYDASPYNAVRMELPMEADPYGSAAARLRDWLASGILARDGQPAIYPYYQTFEDEHGVSHTRTGLFAALRLYDFSEQQVLPHERTLSGPKADRLKMFRETRANLSSIFGLYADPSCTADKLIREFSEQNEPIVDASFQGVRNRLWRITDPGIVGAVQAVLSDRTVYIADGHHRYETGVTYSKECAAANPGHTGSEPYNYILAYLSNIHDEGLLILPIHRLVHSLESFNQANFVARLERDFTVWELPGRKALDEYLANAKSGTTYGIVMPGITLGITLDSKPAEVLSIPVPEVLQNLGVVVLHDLVLSQMLGISIEAMARQTNLTYVTRSRDVYDAVDSGAAQVGIVVKPVRVEEVIAVSGSGEAMPQKSTWFYPKIVTGMVFHSLEQAE
ncbi:MAG: DUF1015 domain-containing protein [Chlorobiaceae bacterium]|nr:DUF1015 domain-containing protein [Chlorobiaceae bacterium]